ncbi:MAG: Alpha/Beta hydrolase protein [Benniella sp.]|nr:MAG: Alpha/Beta hydrolase protein [Benniella sp.]
MSIQFNPLKFNHQTAICGGFKYHYVDEGSRDKDAITVVLIHGFPDLWYGWRYQIQYLASLGGYRVIAPDMLGYGETDKPGVDDDDQCAKNTTEIGGYCHPAYSIRSIASHLVELLDHLQVQKAVFVGHDWGTGIVARLGWHFPERVLAAIAIGNPFRPVTEHLVTIEDYIKENPAFQYMEYFVTPGAASEMNGMVEDIVNDIFTDESGNSNQDRIFYIQNLKNGGFQGPLSYYKSIEAFHHEELCLVGKRFIVPTLLLIVNNDPILHGEYCRQFSTDYFDSIEIDEIQTGEHWILTQNPEAVNRKLDDYLRKLFGQNKDVSESSAAVTLAAASFVSNMSVRHHGRQSNISRL